MDFIQSTTEAHESTEQRADPAVPNDAVKSNSSSWEAKRIEGNRPEFQNQHLLQLKIDKSCRLAPVAQLQRQAQNAQQSAISSKLIEKQNPAVQLPFSNEAWQEVTQREAEAAVVAKTKFIAENESEGVTKGDFLLMLQKATAKIADQILAAIDQTSEHCPYIQKWFSYYSGMSPEHIESAIARFAPAAVNAKDLASYIEAITTRISQALQHHVKTGSISDVPKELVDKTHEPKDFLHIVERDSMTAQLSCLWGDNEVQEENQVALLIPGYEAQLGTYQGYNTQQRRDFLANNGLVDARIKNNDQLSASQKTALMAVLLEGSLQWRNPDDGNDFQSYEIDEEADRNPINRLPQATMNCWEAILYAAHLAGAVTQQQIQEMHANGAEGLFPFLMGGGQRKEVEIPMRSGEVIRTGALQEHLTDLRVGEILYFGGRDHVALAVSENHVMSLNAGVENAPESAKVVAITELGEIIPWINWDFNAVLDDDSSINITVFNPPWG